MIIIGEKINGTIPKVGKAIAEKDEAFIRDLAVKQAEAGAHYIDVCAGTSPEVEEETLIWLMDIVQSAVETPLCIDSPNPRIIEKVFKYAKKPGIINSVSEEGDKCEVIYPLIQGTEWQVIALTCDNRGIPRCRNPVEITKILVEKAAKYDIAPERIHIDPLVMALSTDNESLLKFIETMKRVKEMYPSIKVTSVKQHFLRHAARGVINRHFFALAIYAGMDSPLWTP